MHACTIEIALFADDVPAPCLTLIEFAAWYAIVIAGGNRVAVQDIAGTLIEQLPVYPPAKETGSEITPQSDAHGD